MPAIAASFVSTQNARVKWDYYEDVSGAGGTCIMCGAEKTPHVPHACSKPDYDAKPVQVPVRGLLNESAALLRALHEACVRGDEAEIERLRALLHST